MKYNNRSPKLQEFLEKVDSLCFEYGYEILPNPIKLDNEEQTILIKGNDETIKLLFIDGDGIY